MIKVEIPDAFGQILNATVEIGEGDIVLHSRYGKSTNRDYRPALELILGRLAQTGIKPEVYIDSGREQHLSLAERQVAQPSDLVGSISDQFHFIIRESNADRPSHGAYKRLRLRLPTIPDELGLPPLSDDVLRTIIQGQRGEGPTGGERTAVPLTDEERRWLEGNPKFVNHLKRERAAGLSKKFKADFRDDHGKLFCELCRRDYVDEFGPEVAEACFEMHHTLPVSQMSEGHETTADQLQLLCANCHRAVHRRMANVKSSTDV